LYLVGITYSIAPASDILHELHKVHWLLLTPIFFLIFQQEKIRKYAVNAFLIAMIITLILSYCKGFGLHLFILAKFISKNGQGKVDVFFDHIIQNVFMCYATIIFAYRFFNPQQLSEAANQCSIIKSCRWIYGFLFLLASYNILFMSEGRTGYFIYALFIL